MKDETSALAETRSRDTLGAIGCSKVVAGMWRVREWNMSAAALNRYVQESMALGVTTFDHADIYGGGEVEALFGDALAQTPSLRGKMQIVSKAGIRPRGSSAGAVGVKHYDTSRVYLQAAVERSLQRLKTDYLDLFLIHRPDHLANNDEIADAAESLIQQGKIRAFGVSNFTPRQFDSLRAKIALATNQIEFSPFELQALDDDVFTALSAAAVSPMIWSALGGGRLFSETDELAVRLRQELTTLAEKYNAPSWISIAYAWIFTLPCAPYVLVGSRRVESLQQALDGLGVRLNREDWYAILEAARGKPVP
ncbi:aldo/keto reductase [Caballeronia grimmiae]|uniref:Oxidoreductase n=1 Tax=Caballeronia grimmiae TaxID=1071679 RepID=A0A069NVD5_9BURK|nr:aldo/keto reductase [Caballeronia grimmiae]KDR32142.1 oxidoreductase [Caballeronia grimmiae]GGD78680.1 oxidoreductase [Caballeronia grimmiae]